VKRPAKPSKFIRKPGTVSALVKASKDMDTLLQTPAGRRFIGYLCQSMGFFEPSTILRRDGNGVSQSMTEYNEAIRGYYLRLRDLASPELLAPVEQEADKARRAVPHLSSTEDNKGE